MAHAKNSHRIERLLKPLHILPEVVKGFSQFAAPLTDLTKKGAFTWTELAQKTFEEMKVIMSSWSVLALPDFS